MTDLIDNLAQEIRRVDGDHSLGAGALAEALMPFVATLTAVRPQGGEPVPTAEQVGRLIQQALDLAPKAGLFLEITIKEAGTNV